MKVGPVSSKQISSSAGTACWLEECALFFTALFLHADLTHIFGNTLFLFVSGNTLEDMIDKKTAILG